MPGMPGTGLGGVFYALLVLWIAIRELGLAARQASGRARWLKIGEFTGIIAGIVAMFWFVGWAIKAVAAAAFPAVGAVAGGMTAQTKAIEALVPSVALLPVAILLFLVAAVHVARLATRRTRKVSLPESTPLALGGVDVGPQA